MIWRSRLLGAARAHGWWAAVLALAVVLVVCSRPPVTQIRYVVPAGFRGLLVVVEDSKGGASPARRGQEIVLTFDASQILRLRSTTFFGRYHRSVAEFADGSPLPFVLPGAPVTPDAVAMEGSWTIGPVEQLHFFTVGTAAERTAFASQIQDLLLWDGRLNPSARLPGGIDFSEEP